MLLVGCSDSGDAATTSPTTATTVTSTVSSTTVTSTATSTTEREATTTAATTTTVTGVDCGELTNGTHHVTIAGRDRTFEVRVPEQFGIIGPAGAARLPAPAIVLFHGFIGTASAIVDTTGLGVLAPESGVVLIAPQGIGDLTTWHIGDDSWGDVELSDHIVQLLRSSPCVDPDAVWLAGFSAGAAWTGVYGCSHTAGIAGLLIHSGLPPAICPADSTPNIMVVHGTADPIVPFDGGPQAVEGSTVDLQPVPESAAAWAAVAGCDPSPAVRDVGEGSTISTWSGCAGGRTVSLQAVEGLGHQWSGGFDAKQHLNAGCVLVQALTDDPDPVATCQP